MFNLGIPMIVTASQWIAVAAGLWLIALGVYMLVQPRGALAALARMGGSTPIHFGEMALRILIGLALIGAAPGSRFPLAVTVIGGFLIASALVLLILPRRWHAAYSTWWSRHIPVRAVRLIAPLSWAMGAILIWTVV